MPAKLYSLLGFRLARVKICGRSPELPNLECLQSNFDHMQLALLPAKPHFVRELAK